MLKTTQRILFGFLMLVSTTLSAQDLEVLRLAQVGTIGETEPILANTTWRLWLHFKANSDITGRTVNISYAFDDGKFELYEENLATGSMAAGDSFSRGLVVNVPDKAGDSTELVVVMSMTGDSKTSNDTLRTKYLIASKARKDLLVEMVSPANNSDVKTWSDLPVTLKLTNNGLDTYERGKGLGYWIYANGTLIADRYIDYDGPSLAPGESGEITIDLNVNRNAAQGPLEICVLAFITEKEGNTYILDESALTGNNGCADLNVVANGVDEQVMTLELLQYLNGQVRIGFTHKAEPSTYRIDVVGIDGKGLATTNFNAVQGQPISETLDLPRVSSGMYLVHIYANDAFVGSEKIMIPQL